MFEFTETISVQAPPSAVWEVLRDIEGWWLASNPEHDSLERPDDRDTLEVGAQLRIRERNGGIPGEAIGNITRVEPGWGVRWGGLTRRARWCVIPASKRRGGARC